MKLRYKITSAFLVLLVVSVASLALVLRHNAPCGPAQAAAGTQDLMKAVVRDCYGSPDVLKVEAIQKPVIGDDGILIKVHSASVNPLDWHTMRGLPYIMRLDSGLGAPKFHGIGVDFAGTVEAVGRDIKQFKTGDAVFGGKSGAFAEYITVHGYQALALKPDNLTFEQAAAVPVAGVTALQALRDKGKIKPGRKVLINGASGGVGTFAVQIARAFGAEVTGVCSTRNLELVRSLGADHIIDYPREDYTENGQRYDLIIDNVGNHSVLANSRLLNPGGRLVIVGAQKGDWIKPLMGIIQILVYSPFIDHDISFLMADLTKDDLAILAELMQSGKVTPVIDRRYPLSKISKAIRYSEAGHARGKIIIDMAP